MEKKKNRSFKEEKQKQIELTELEEMGKPGKLRIDRRVRTEI